MRCVAGVGLLALVGCNQVFGIAATTAWDAGIDGDLAMPHARLTWQIAEVTPAGAPDPTIEYAAIVPAPPLRIAPIDVALDDSVDRAMYSQGGVIPLPGAYVATPDTMWRLEYVLPGAVPREVQWKPDYQVGHVTVPLFGRLERAPWPMDGGYTATASNDSPGYMAPRVFTTGLWTEGRAQVSGAVIDYGYFNAISLSGSKGGPDPAAGDRAFVVDYAVDAGGCQVAMGSAMLPSAELEPGMHTMQTMVWDGRPRPVASSIDVQKPLTRLVDALGPLGSPGSYTGTLLFGIGASPLMPGLSATPSNLLLSGAATLPVPMMLTLLRCQYNNLMSMVTPPQAAQPAALDAFPHLLHLQITNTRVIDGVTFLTSGLETVAIIADAQGDVQFSAAIPVAFQLTTPQQTFDLGGPTDHIAVGPPGGVFTFRFAAERPGPDAPADLRVDYHDVVLHRIAAGALTPVRIYTVTSPEVRIDGPVLASGAEYVFEVRSYQGHPKAQRGDFAAVTYPYGSAVVFTRTFRMTADGV